MEDVAGNLNAEAEELQMRVANVARRWCITLADAAMLCGHVDCLQNQPRQPVRPTVDLKRPATANTAGLVRRDSRQDAVRQAAIRRAKFRNRRASLSALRERSTVSRSRERLQYAGGAAAGADGGDEVDEDLPSLPPTPTTPPTPSAAPEAHSTPSGLPFNFVC